MQLLVTETGCQYQQTTDRKPYVGYCVRPPDDRELFSVIAVT